MKIFNKRKRRTSHKHGNLGEYMLDFHVSGRIGNEPVYGLGVVDVLEIAELRSEHFLREKLAEDARGFGADVANGEVVAQKKEEVYVVFPLGTSSQGVCLHCGELEQRRQTESLLETDCGFDGERVLEECHLNVVDDEIHLLLDATGDGVGELRGGNLVEVALVVDGSRLEQVEVNGAAVPQV